MPEIVQIALIMIASLAGLVWSAHFFVGGSASLAKQFGMRPGLIGLTIVAFGTSAPEIFVSADAALANAPELGVGNAVGSNIANIGLVLGVSCLIAKLPIDRPLFKLEIPLLIFATGAAVVVLFDGYLSRSEGLLLLGGAALMPFVLIYDPRKPPDEECCGDEDAFEEEIPDLSKTASWLWLLGGLIALLISSEFLVRSAKDLALVFGVSPMIVGLTVVALGTSLPELAASITSLMKGHSEMAIGNIIGSNILNILAVMSLPGVIAPAQMPGEILTRDALTMVALTVALLIIGCIKHRKSPASQDSSSQRDVQANSKATPHDAIANNQNDQTNVAVYDGSAYLGRKSGALFLLVYIIYYAMIFSANH